MARTGAARPSFAGGRVGHWAGRRAAGRCCAFPLRCGRCPRCCCRGVVGGRAALCRSGVVGCFDVGVCRCRRGGCCWRAQVLRVRRLPLSWERRQQVGLLGWSSGAWAGRSHSAAADALVDVAEFCWGVCFVVMGHAEFGVGCGRLSAAGGYQRSRQETDMKGIPDKEPVRSLPATRSSARLSTVQRVQDTRESDRKEKLQLDTRVTRKGKESKHKTKK